MKLLSIKNVEIREMLVATVTTEQIQLCANDCHGVSVPRLWQSTRKIWLHPRHRFKIDDVHVIEALGTIITTKHVQLVC